ncbi:CBO0543 family protein [Geobacillus sp. FJAT-46040]|uniref:CBO0543 family protein n=1 Tax=Geobacillus sp. FJAT-46040 TaxID=2011017 RepID=UPI00350EA743
MHMRRVFSVRSWRGPGCWSIRSVFFASYINNSVIFEYLLYPVVSVYVYATSRRARWPGVAAQCAGYAAVLTALEVVFERHTDLIEYHGWKWEYSLVTMFLLTLAVRLLAGRMLRRNE